MANRAIKKRLIASIISIAAASVLLVVCVAAYYSSSTGGGDNVTGAANFVVNAAFESGGVTLTNDSRLPFKDTTVVNAIEIKDAAIGDADYALKHNRYLTDGDDGNFNKLALLIKATVTNSSGTDVYARFSVSTTVEVGLEYFCLTDAEAAEVVSAIEASETPTYDTYFRAAYDAYAAASPDSAPKESDYSTEYREYLYAVNEYTVSARNTELSSLVIGKSGSVVRYMIVWLDWRKYSETVNADAFVPASMPVTVTASVTNQAGGAL